MTQDDASKDAILTRQLLREELDASNSYQGKANASADPDAKALYNDISREEKVHAGELSQLLSKQDPDGAKAQQEGMREAESIVKSEDFDMIEAFGFTKSNFGDAIQKAGFDWSTGKDWAQHMKGKITDAQKLGMNTWDMEEYARHMADDVGDEVVAIDEPSITTAVIHPSDAIVNDDAGIGHKIPQQYADISINAGEDEGVIKSNDAERLADGFEAVIKSSMQKAGFNWRTGNDHAKFIRELADSVYEFFNDPEAAEIRSRLLDKAQEYETRGDKVEDIEEPALHNNHTHVIENPKDNLYFAIPKQYADTARNAEEFGKSEEFNIRDIMPSFEDDLNARIQKNNEMGNFSVAKTDAIKGAWKYSDLRINEQIDFSAKKAPTKEDGMSVKDVKVGPKKKD